jgi:hypothetical protein
MAKLKVNFSDQEVTSEARTFEPLPSGEYYVRITEVLDKECGPESKNPGKPYYNVECTVQDGPHEGRKLFTNAMLFDGALYTISQMCKATGFGDRVDPKSKTFGDIPDGEEFVSKEAIVVVKKQRDTWAEERDGDGQPQYKNEIKGFKPYQGESPSAAGHKQTKAGAGSLLP